MMAIARVLTEILPKFRKSVVCQIVNNFLLYILDRCLRVVFHFFGKFSFPIRLKIAIAKLSCTPKVFETCVYNIIKQNYVKQVKKQ